MPQQISWKLDAEVGGGPKASASELLKVDAYDQILVEVKSGDGDIEAGIQPADTGVKLLVILSSVYDPKLTYSVNAKEPDETKRTRLDAPQFLAGEGAVSLLGATPKTLFFYNTTSGPDAKDASISILVGRDL